MLIWILIIGACVRFHNFARDNGLKKWLWAFMPLLGYLTFAIIGALSIVIMDESLLDNIGVMFVAEILAASLGVGIAYLLMKTAASKLESKNEDADLLDNDFQ